MTTFLNFAVKAETVQATRVVKPNLKKNIKDVGVHVRFMYSRIKNLKRYDVRRPINVQNLL